MSRVLLCYARNNALTYDAHAPLSILTLGTFLECAGIAVDYFDERIDALSDFRRALSRRPALVGFSVMGGYQIRASARLARLARDACPSARIVWGGYFPTVLPDVVLQAGYADVVVTGEGEETLLDLARLNASAPLNDLRGVAFAQADGTIRHNAPRQPPDIESLPFPYQGGARDMLRRHLTRTSIREAVGFEVSRGCPHRCPFCYSPDFHQGLRVKSPAKVASELEALRQLGVQDIDIYDDTLFGGERASLPDYLERLRASGMTWIANFRAEHVDPDTLSSMAAAGCRWLYFGLEAADDARRSRMKPGLRTSQVEAAVRCLAASGIGTVYSVIFGAPTDGAPDELARCLDFVDRLHATHPEAEIQIQSFVPLPATALYELALERGFSPPTTPTAWARHDHFRIRNPWLADPALGRKLYLWSFLAFRYRRHLSRLPWSLVGYPLHRLAAWRFRSRRFEAGFEPHGFDVFDTVTGWGDAARFLVASRRWPKPLGPPLCP